MYQLVDFGASEVVKSFQDNIEALRLVCKQCQCSIECTRNRSVRILDGHLTFHVS